MTPEENREAEERLAGIMGREESARVGNAVAETIGARVAYAMRRKLIAAILEERRRCLAACRRFPDNLVAQQIAREIEVGPK